ncbi:chaperonin GroEL [candidate division WWE3 bacterium CG10_big_fil_rev_8_21_14_0_10_32_10]|uniref:Chaperonin GroEL n=1 Tax=candidate division WWE3 bacterium CG10_big_fil_rev_8_21_14_0_10_32_10 TaxID=1975090 RepID=A0A2H0RA09_UNCKA|nr:MAG: chaperonin GroEL [candidate division WWE3 bacterium CG10_big_fil_rev_8_21_14_0_10_32_10]
MAKQVIYDAQAKQKLKKGIDALANAVATTMGPKGRNVAMAKSYGSPTVTHDGVTVAKEIELKDPFENMGAQMVAEAASKTNDVAGDGTTTATVLAQAIVNEGLKITAAGANPMVLRRGLEEASKAVVEYIKTKSATPIKTKQEKAMVATISSQNEEIGKLIADALEKVGDSGVITAEEGQGLQTYTEVKEGMVIDRGYVSSYFVTDSDKMESVIEDAHILITDKKISSMQDILPMLENLVKISKNFVIVAEDVEGEALATLVVNKMRGTFNALAIKAPGFGDRRKEMLQDLAVLTGANYISEDLGRKLDSVTVEDLGRVGKVISSKEETVFVGGAGEKKQIKDRALQIKNEIKNTTSDYDKEKLQERLAKLTGGVAIVYVGAATETELKEKKYRVEDAVNATKAAIEGGVVPGGGVTLIKSSTAIDTLKLNEAEMVGARILQRALDVPFRMILQNAGVDAGYYLQQVKASKKNIGFDVMKMKMVDMVENGIIDPAKVATSAVENAVSVSINILTTEALIADIKEDKEETPSMGGGMGGMDGMM